MTGARSESGASAQSQGHPLVVALRRRPRLRAGVIQLSYVALGVALGTLVPQLSGGPTISGDQVDLIFADIGIALIALVSVVYTLLFLVVQFAATTHSPRLNMFRDSPLVWHAFGLFLGTLSFTTAAIVAVGPGQPITVMVPAVAAVLVLACLGVARQLQLNALNALQLAPILGSVGDRGRDVIDQLYPDPFSSDAAHSAVAADLPYGVRWPHRSSVLRQIDLPRFLAEAERLESVVHVRVRVGATLWEQQEIIGLSVQPTPAVERHLLSGLEAGLERSFTQDPLLALRLLNDIALRALSSAVNDPYTAVQAIDAIEALLRRLAIAQLDVGLVVGSNGRGQVLLTMPDWEAFVAAGVDEPIHFGKAVPSVRSRLLDLVNTLIATSPPERRPALEKRLPELSGD